MRESLEEFSRLYDERPIKSNRFGTQSPHLFALWCLLKKLKPTHVVESGVWRGQSTWLIEKARPEAALFCIDLNFNSLAYRSKTAMYLHERLRDSFLENVSERSHPCFFLTITKTP